MKTLHIIFALIAFQFVNAQEVNKIPKPKYIIYLIGDGMGMAQVEATDLYQRTKKNDTVGLSIKKIPLVSMISTVAYKHPITCSAAAGTALSTGNKTSLGTIGMNFDHTKNFTTIAEFAKQKNYKVGIMSSVFVNHATPAAFYAKVAGRNDYHSIGMQLVRSQFDVFAGGIIENSDGDTNVYEYARKNGYRLISNRTDFNALKSLDSKIIIGSKELNGNENIANAIDRKPGGIALKDYLNKTIELLQSDKTGFFIMCEGGKIDWACHANDIGYMVGEVLDFDNAIQSALDFYRKHPDETLVIVTADHETGGLAMGNTFMEYEVNPLAIDNQKCSNEYFAGLMNELKKQNSNSIELNALDSVKKYYGLGKNVNLTAYDSLRLNNAIKTSLGQIHIGKDETKMLYGSYEAIGTVASKILAEKAGLGWTTFYHTGIPVPLRVIGAGSELFKGLTDNTEIAKLLFKMIQ